MRQCMHKRRLAGAHQDHAFATMRGEIAGQDLDHLVVFQRSQESVQFILEGLIIRTGSDALVHQELGRQRQGKPLDGRRLHGQPVVGHRARDGKMAFDGVETVHPFLLDPAALRKITGELEGGGMNAQEIGIQGEDHTRAVQPVMGPEIDAEGNVRSFALGVVAERFVFKPLRIGKDGADAVFHALDAAGGRGFAEEIKSPAKLVFLVSEMLLDEGLKIREGFGDNGLVLTKKSGFTAIGIV